MKFWARKVCHCLIFLIILPAVVSCGTRNDPSPTVGVEESADSIAEYPEESAEGDNGQETADGDENHPVAAAEFYYMELEEQLRWEELLTVNGDWMYYVDTVYVDTEPEEGKEEEFYRWHWGVYRRSISEETEPELYLTSEKIIALCHLCTLFADGAGNCYTFWTVDDENDLDNPDREPVGYFMEKHDKDGTLVWHADYALDELDNAGESLDQGTASEDGRIFLYHIGAGERIFAFGKDGKPEQEYIPDLKNLDGVAAGKDGQAYAYCVTGEQPVFAELGGMGETYVCPMRPLQVYSGREDGIYLCSRNGLWVYIPENGETRMLWGWDDEYIQMDVNSIRQISRENDTVNLLCREQFGNANGSFSLLRWKNVLTFASVSIRDSRSHPGKETVTMELSEYYEQFPDHTEYLVRRYNRQSRDYKVEITYHEGNYIEELKNQLLRGNGPDLIGLRNMDIADLAAKGAFEELDGYYAGSGLAGWEDILAPVQKACMPAGKNVLVIPAFHIENMRAYRTEEMEKMADGWTPVEFLEFARGKRIFRDQSPTTAFRYCMGISPGEHFIDYERRESHFDCEEFRQILEECRKWEKFTYQSAGVFPDTQLAYSENWDWLLEEMYYYELQDFVMEDEAAILVGYPGWDGPECELVSEEVYAINSTSGNKEGAWDFLEFLLSEQTQNAVDWAFPVRRDVFEDSLTAPYVNPQYIAREPEKKDLDAVRKWVDCAVYNHWPGWSPLWTILTEEASMYFEGDATLEDTVAKIQNRVQLYLDEL